MALDQTCRRLLQALGLALLAVAVFWPIREHAFLLYDDDVYVTANPYIALGWSRDGIAWAFSTVRGANWFPLTWLSWMLDWELYGLDPKGFHSTSLALHALATGALFLALVRLTGSAGRSAFVAAVFAVHPLHVESVAWISTRKDTLSGLCFALALLAYAPAGPHAASRSTRAADAARPGARKLALVALFLALGLLAKQVLVTLPFVLLLLDDWPLRRLRRDGDAARFDAAALLRALAEKLPLLVLAAVFSAVAIFAQRSGGTVASFEQLPLADRLGNAVVAYASYLGKAVWPAELAVFYPHPKQAIPGWKLAGAAALLLGLTAGALRAARRPSPLAVGWFWFLGTLLPVIGIVQIGAQAHADRYSYLPLIGLAIAVAWGAPELLARVAPRAPRPNTWLAAAACSCLAALVVSTSLQLRHWRDTEALMRHALAVTRENHIAHAYLGVALLQQGRTRETVEHWKQAAELEPAALDVTNNLAWLLATTANRALRNPEQALVFAERAARLAPEDPAVLDTLAAAQAAAGRFDAARRTAGRALARAEASEDAALAAEIRARLALYETGRAVVEP